VGVGDVFLCLGLLVGVSVGDGVGETLCFGEAVGEGLGVGVFARCFRCFRAGVGVGVGSKIFLIFVPSDSSAAFAAQTAPNNIAKIKSHFMIEQCP